MPLQISNGPSSGGVMPTVETGVTINQSAVREPSSQGRTTGLCPKHQAVEVLNGASQESF